MRTKSKIMEIRINAIHFDISERLAEFINKKAERLARRNVDITYVDFNLKVVKPETAMNKEVTIKVIVPGAGETVATKVADSFEEAVDLCIDAADHQLAKIKGKK